MGQHTAMQVVPAFALSSVAISPDEPSRPDPATDAMARGSWDRSAFTPRMPLVLARARFWPVRARKAADIVGRDADRLIAQWGEAAYEKAAVLSSREDAGLVPSPSAGHWWRVRDEIGARLGRRDDDHRADFAPGRRPVFDGLR